MKRNYTHLILVLDESSSMWGLTKATIEGVNGLVTKQKSEPGDFTTAVYKFSSSVSEVTTFQELNQMNYRPNGSTALLDAMGIAISSEGRKLAELPESERPDKVVVVVVTDGEENTSQTYKIDQIKSMVTLQQNAYNWQFVFLGANIDAFATGGSYGFTAKSTMQYQPTHDSVVRCYAAVSDTLTSFRAGSLNAMDLSAQKTDDTKQ